VYSFNIAEAKAQFSEIVERAAAGEEIRITKRGRPMVRLVSLVKPTGRLDVEKLRALTSGMKMYEDPDGLSFVQRMRLEDRY
jgi:prevent-host-death family protein